MLVIWKPGQRSLSTSLGWAPSCPNPDGPDPSPNLAPTRSPVPTLPPGPPSALTPATPCPAAMTPPQPTPCPQARGGAAPLRLCPHGSAGAGPGKGTSRWRGSGQSGPRWRSLRWPGGCRLCTGTGGRAGSHCTWMWEGRGHQACRAGEAKLPLVAAPDTSHLRSGAQLPSLFTPPFHACPHIRRGSPSSRDPLGPPPPIWARSCPSQQGWGLSPFHPPCPHPREGLTDLTSPTAGAPCFGPFLWLVPSSRGPLSSGPAPTPVTCAYSWPLPCNPRARSEAYTRGPVKRV